MLPFAEARYDSLIPPQSVNDTATTGLYVDTQGFTQSIAWIQFGAIGAADVTKVAFQHSDTTTDGDFADITGSAVTTVSATDDNKGGVYLINYANNIKRYVRAYVDPGAVATLMSAGMLSFQGQGSPISAATAGSYTDGSTRTQGLEFWISL